MPLGLGMWIVATLACLAQTPPIPAHYVDIRIPRGVDSAGVFIRYVLDHDFGAWVTPRPDVSSYFIATTHDGRAAAHIKALLYAPGCAMQKLDLEIAGSDAQTFPFACNPVPWITVDGVLNPAGGRETELEVKYVARWAQKFLDLDDGIVTDIPVAKAIYRANTGRFRVSIPDLSKDPLAVTGEFQIWVKEIKSGRIIARLTPANPDLSQVGGLKIAAAYPPEIEFATCDTPQSGPRDSFGFAIRTVQPKVCDQ